MRYLFIHEISYLNKPVFEYQDFPERLASAGNDVVVIDFVESQPSKKMDRMVSRTGLAKVRLITIPHRNFPVLKYFQAQFNFIKILLNLLRANHFDAIVLYSVFINGVTTLKLAAKFGVPVFFRAIDVYHKLRPGFLVQTILKIGEKVVYRGSNYILATNVKLKNYVLRYLPSSLSEHNKVYVLDHGVDVPHFSKSDLRLGLAKMLNINDGDFVVVFLGTTYSFSRLDQLLILLAPIIKQKDNWKMLIIGAGELDEAISKSIFNQGLVDKVHAIGMIDYNELPSYLSLGSVGINTFEINDITRDIIPIKNYQYIAAGLPVVSSPLPDLIEKIPPNPCGIFYAASDDLSDLVSELINISKRHDFDSMSQFVSDYALREHSVDSSISRLKRLLDRVYL